MARKAAVQDEITNALRAFYCTLCDKQFQNVAQYDEHTNSYAHHHKARFKDMQANARPKPQEDIDKRKEKERKREERELRKIAAAAGIKVPKAVSSIPQAGLAPSAVAAADISPAMDVDGRSTQKKGGWASIGTTSASTTPSAGFKKSGWATVGPPSEMSPSTPPPPPPLESSKSSAWATVSSTSIPSQTPATSSNHAPSFRTGGWTSLDTGTVNAHPSFTAAHIPDSHLPSPLLYPPQSTGRDRGSSQAVSAPATLPAPQSEVHGIPTPRPTAAAPALPSQPFSMPSTQPTRSGWQKFQAKNNKRR